MHRQRLETRQRRAGEEPQPFQTRLHFQEARRTPGAGPQPSRRRAARAKFSGVAAAAAATLAEVGDGGFGTAKTQALGKAKPGPEMGEVGILIEAEIIDEVGVVNDEGAAEDVDKVERAQLGSKRRQFRVDELADPVEG